MSHQLPRTRDEKQDFVVGAADRGKTAVSDGHSSGWQDLKKRDGGWSQFKQTRQDNWWNGIVCVLDDNCDEWIDEPGLTLEDQEDSEESDVDRRNLLVLSARGEKTRLC